MGAMQQMLLSGGGKTKFTGSFNTVGTHTLNVPAGVTTLKLTGRGGYGTTDLNPFGAAYYGGGSFNFGNGWVATLSYASSNSIDFSAGSSMYLYLSSIGVSWTYYGASQSGGHISCGYAQYNGSYLYTEWELSLPFGGTQNLNLNWTVSRQANAEYTNNYSQAVSVSIPGVANRSWLTGTGSSNLGTESIYNANLAGAAKTVTIIISNTDSYLNYEYTA